MKPFTFLSLPWSPSQSEVLTHKGALRSSLQPKSVLGHPDPRVRLPVNVSTRMQQLQSRPPHFFLSQHPKSVPFLELPLILTVDPVVPEALGCLSVCSPTHSPCRNPLLRWLPPSLPLHPEHPFLHLPSRSFSWVTCPAHPVLSHQGVSPSPCSHPAHLGSLRFRTECPLPISNCDLFVQLQTYIYNHPLHISSGTSPLTCQKSSS